MKKTILALSVALAGSAVTSTAMAQDDAPIDGNLRIVIGSTSTGGDTYQNSEIVAQELSDKLDMNVKVDAVGATEAFKTLERNDDGNTMMIFHDMSYLGHLYGVRGYDNVFEEFNVGPSIAINPGNAYLVPKDSPYDSFDDIKEAVADGERVRVSIQPGGVSEIGFSAMKNAIRIEHPGAEENLVAVNSGSQSDKNQQMFDGLADVINGSVQSNEQFTRLEEDDQKAMKFIWLTAREDTIKQTLEEGMGETTREELLEYTEPNVTVTQDGEKNFTFDKEFFFIYNKDMDQEIVDYMDEALADIYDEGEIQETQKQSFFIPNFKPSDESREDLKQKMNEYKEIIESIDS
ncbi:ABC transporter substrate-binding protein [Aidingimonas halophila]|uniref:Tripartite-type tricarboxylate transporter, receptor component TctC n=1 Tax=Aidingimonas halophila TaxID=574349 RepID=A0A1H3F635_9GAMM|nr:ABC transporter substrate-binding protein [Aidingimonas halophila]GHC32338.1 hypothetical protein GCM10008094_26390 [Aidingimonas halophila]SDX85818.1 Tripartite-type tricarboxylate transporter, receptor component TctC [Aidingimonas halophila]